MQITKSLVDLGLKSEFSSVAVAIKVKGLNVFATPAKYINHFPNKMLIHSIGGKCQKDELWHDAINREIAEELGIEAFLLSSQSTKLVTSEGFQSTVILTDRPSPYCVYKKTKDDDISFYTHDIQWMVGYMAEISEESLFPPEELGLLIFLTDEMLIRCYSGIVSLKDILNSKDGSKVIVNSNHIEFRKVIVPAGLAIVLANDLLKK